MNTGRHSPAMASKRKWPDKIQNRPAGNKRRREQESAYIEELADLISSSNTNLDSWNVKPEERAKVEEVVKGIKQQKQQQASDPSVGIQHDHVSSSNPGVIAKDKLGPVLLEALDGFLFVVNCHGKIDFITENVSSYLTSTQDDLMGTTVFNLIAQSDHQVFRNCLHPLTAANNSSWMVDPMSRNKRNHSTFELRMKTKLADDADIHDARFITMKCSAMVRTSLKNEDTGSSNTDQPSHLFCIARRLTIEEMNNTRPSNEVFSTNHDFNGKILRADVDSLQPPHYNREQLVGQNYFDLCFAQDRELVRNHFDEGTIRYFIF
ncbi:nuclear receptor coactivator 3-like [Anneissia japonica]|uniref:nuclear receptor coactivator 3-like n=1 Tax=Anneissia japonica TaxID=1529436 RepID=UPI001425B506|nr:nuclear receptor coactivator 3-like [Anneissia japonica]